MGSVTSRLGARLGQVGPGTKEPNPERHQDSFHRGMCPLLVVAQCFALMPVSGVAADSPSKLRFTWLSLRVLYAVLAAMGLGFVFLATVLHVRQEGLSFNNLTGLVFAGNTFLTTLMFLHLATKWASLAQQWQTMEYSLWHYGYPRHFGRRCRVITVGFLTAAAVENGMAIYSGMKHALACSQGGTDIFRAYFTKWFQMYFQHTQYAAWKALFVQIGQFLCTFSWSYMDIFLILLCYGIVARFQQINSRLLAIRDKMMSERFWRQTREDYNNLCRLTKDVDAHVSHIVMLCFVNDIYYICLHLLNSIRNARGNSSSVYFFYSFAYLLVRTFAFCLSASAIHDESKRSYDVLCSVPSESYCTEVDRLLSQVVNDNVNLTCFRLFGIKRSLVLSVFSTIVTYEVLLMQLNPKIIDVEKTNTTVVCYD